MPDIPLGVYTTVGGNQCVASLHIEKAATVTVSFASAPACRRTIRKRRRATSPGSRFRRVVSEPLKAARRRPHYYQSSMLRLSMFPFPRRYHH